MRNVIFIFLLLSFWPGPLNAEVIRIAVAANFKPTLAIINAHFETNTPHTLKVTSASTGAIASQLLQGAPFDIFFAADEAAPQRVAKQKETTPKDFFCYARGQLSLIGGNGDLQQLGDPALSIAIANPATAPYGKAAQEVLRKPDYRSGAARKIVRGNNTIQAYQFWHTGSTDLALVPLSLTRTTRDNSAGNAITVPAHWHRPIEQYLLVLNHSKAIDAYMKWFRSDTVRTIIEQAGYLPCH